MRIATCLLACAIAFTSFASARAENEMQVAPARADARTYGEYPIAYREIIQRWLGNILADPASAVIDWSGDPKPGEYKTQKGKRYVGYVVDFKVNARNRFGSYTGKQKYRAVIFNGDVLWVGHPQY